MTNNLAKILKDQGRSQRWLAEKLYVSYQTINNWCNQRYQPSYTDLQEISILLNVDYFDLKQ